VVKCSHLPELELVDAQCTKETTVMTVSLHLFFPYYLQICSGMLPHIPFLAADFGFLKVSDDASWQGDINSIHFNH